MRKLFSVLLLLTTATPALAGAEISHGVWSGEMRQVEINAEAKYPMTLTVKDASLTSHYPTLNCSGSWTKVGEADGYSIYSEKISNAPGATCIDGLVMVKQEGRTIILGWFAAYAGAPSLAAATLTKSPSLSK